LFFNISSFTAVILQKSKLNEIKSPKHSTQTRNNQSLSNIPTIDPKKQCLIVFHLTSSIYILISNFPSKLEAIRRCCSNCFVIFHIHNFCRLVFACVAPTFGWYNYLSPKKVYTKCRKLKIKHWGYYSLCRYLFISIQWLFSNFCTLQILSLFPLWYLATIYIHIFRFNGSINKAPWQDINKNLYSVQIFHTKLEWVYFLFY
jgi:hypothetical protein